MEESSLNSVRCTMSILQTPSRNTNPVSRSDGPLQQNHKTTGKIYTVSKLTTLELEKINVLKSMTLDQSNTMGITTDHKPVVTFLKIHLSKRKLSATEKITKHCITPRYKQLRIIQE